MPYISFNQFTAAAKSERRLQKQRKDARDAKRAREIVEEDEEDVYPVTVKRKKAKVREVVEEPFISGHDEKALMEKIKNSVGSDEVWSQFLHCLDIFAKQVDFCLIFSSLFLV